MITQAVKSGEKGREGREKQGDRRWACTPTLKIKSAGPVIDWIRAVRERERRKGQPQDFRPKQHEGWEYRVLTPDREVCPLRIHNMTT